MGFFQYEMAVELCVNINFLSTSTFRYAIFNDAPKILMFEGK